MAKCVKNISTEKIKRLTEKNYKEIFEIINLVKNSNWKYVPKKEWKALRPKPIEKISKENKKNK